MEELNLESSLSIEEIERNFQDVDFFSGIMEGLQEALAVKKGEAAEDTLIRNAIYHFLIEEAKIKGSLM